MSDFDLSVLFFLCARIGQSQVVSEMLAGFILGPSPLGRMLPSIQGAHFPMASNTMICAVAEVAGSAS